MNTRRIVLTVSVFVLGVLLLSNATTPVSATNAPPAAPNTAVWNSPIVVQPPLPPIGLLEPHNPGPGEIEIMGTMWQPQTRKMFADWTVLGWGTALRLKPAKSPSDQWVHISPTMLNRFNSVNQKITYVVFCAASSNPLVSRPTALHLWTENNNRFFATNLTWANTTARQCKTVNFIPATLQFGIGLSVLLHLPNGVDTITLQEVWVGFSD